MSQSELLASVLNLLTSLNIPYMVTVSIVSSLQGEPRSTHDIDLVVQLQRQSIPALIQVFPKPEFYLNENSVADAIERKHMFNLLHSLSGNKVDFWLLTDTSYDRARFARRQLASVLGLDNFYISSPEDTIISKLKWSKLAGGSEKQIVDAVRVFEMQFDRLNIDYIKYWVDQLDLQSQWQQLVNQAEPY